jgi:hypothetical protein
MTGTTSGAGMYYLSGTPDFTPVYFAVYFSRSLFLILAILLSVLRVTAYDCPIGNFKLFVLDIQDQSVYVNNITMRAKILIRDQ